MFDLQICVVAELEKCDGPTSANIIKSLFEFVRQSTPCSKFKSAEVSNGSSNFSLLSTISLTALLSSLSILIGRVGF